MKTCETCNDQGLIGVCPSCGKIKYEAAKAEVVETETPFPIPTYYKRNLWSSDKVVSSNNSFTRATLGVLDKLVMQVVKGDPISSSFIFLLPKRTGKRTAMYTMMMAYHQQGFSVAPPIDIATLAVIENHFSAKDKSIVEKWEMLTKSDFLCVYGVDFTAKYQTMSLFSNLCSIRALNNKPTILFAENKLSELKGFYDTVDYTSEMNSQDVCKLTNPYIMDGMVEEKLNEL